MTGIFLLFVILLWIVFLIWLVPRSVRSIQSKPIKLITSILLFGLLIPAPLTDEIIGGFQFRSLCNQNKILMVTEEKANGMKVNAKLSDNGLVRGTIIPIREFLWDYSDTETNKLIVSYKTYRAHGGFIIKNIGILENDSPLTFNEECMPEEAKTIFKRLSMTIIYK